MGKVYQSSATYLRYEIDMPQTAAMASFSEFFFTFYGYDLSKCIQLKHHPTYFVLHKCRSFLLTNTSRTGNSISLIARRAFHFKRVKDIAEFRGVLAFNVAREKIMA